uniref:Polycystin cation channel PKD1/PKD2 domain-containing protein n=1 Tax=Arcella intermedia TaxID=1963864 RepID=A0A6B2KYF7_9EUKA
MSPLERVNPYVCCSLQALFYLGYLILLSYTTSSINAPYALNYHDQLMGTYFDPDGDFGSISDFDSFWNWVNNVLIPTTLPDSLDNRFQSHTWMATPHIRFRQYRVEPTNPADCPLTQYNLTCYPASSIAYDQGKFIGLNFPAEDWKGTTWANPPEAGQYLHGLYFTYPPGGYLTYLDTNQSNALAQVELLKNVSWIDYSTRAVAIEFAIYNLDANVFAMFHVLMEFTHIKAVAPITSIIIIENNTFIPSENASLLILLLWTLGLILQEGAELLVTGISKYENLRKKFLRVPRSVPQEHFFCCGLPCYQFTTSFWKNIYSQSPVIIQAFFQTLGEHFFDFWNVLDFVTNAAIFVYIVITYVITINSSIRILDPTDVSIDHLWNLEHLIEIAAVFGAIGVIIAYFRLLYFFLPWHWVGPLVISMLRMYIDIIYFIALLFVMVVGFASAFNLIYGGSEEIFTGWAPSVFTCVTIAFGDQQFITNDEFLPLPLAYFGDLMMIVYVVLSVILLVNLLIAMMGSTYGDLMEDSRPIEGEWSVATGEILLHYERFLFLPPPLNILQFFLFGALLPFAAISFCCTPIEGRPPSKRCIEGNLSFMKKVHKVIFASWDVRDRLLHHLIREKAPQRKEPAKPAPPPPQTNDKDEGCCLSCCQGKEPTDTTAVGAQSNNKGCCLSCSEGVRQGVSAFWKDLTDSTTSVKYTKKYDRLDIELKQKEDALWDYVKKIIAKYDKNLKVKKAKRILLKVHEDILDIEKQ